MPDLVAFLSRFSAVSHRPRWPACPGTTGGVRTERSGSTGAGVTAARRDPIPPSQAAEVRRQLATAPGVADTPRDWPWRSGRSASC